MTTDRQAILLERALVLIQEEYGKTREQAIAWLEDDSQDWTPPRPIPPVVREGPNFVRPLEPGQVAMDTLTTFSTKPVTPEDLAYFAAEEKAAILWLHAARHHLRYNDPYLTA